MKQYILLITAVIVTSSGLSAVETRTEGEKTYFAMHGEGYTATDFSEGIVVGHRMFSAPDNAAMCACSPKPALLITNKNEYVMKVGETFSPEDLRVVAVDTVGKTIKPTPIIICIEEKTPELWVGWDNKSKRVSSGSSEIRALRPGSFRMRISSFCERLENDLFINFNIVPNIPSPAKTELTYNFVCIWPETHWRFNHPSGIAIDTQGNIYVSDTENHCIQKFTASGAFIAKWGNMGTEDGQFSYPSAIAIDTQGNIYVADGANHRIQKFTASGSFITKWGSHGTGDGQFSGPSGIAVDSQGNIYVADNYNNRVQKFTASGAFIAKWGSYGTGDGQFSGASDIAVDSQGNVYVLDRDNRRIKKFTSSGYFIAKWGCYGTEDEEFIFPSGIAVDSQGNVYVADERTHRVQKFTASGSFIAKWGSYGTENGQFKYPAGMAIDSQGNVYVADSGNNRIQKFTSSQRE